MHRTTDQIVETTQPMRGMMTMIRKSIWTQMLNLEVENEDTSVRFGNLILYHHFERLLVSPMACAALISVVNCFAWCCWPIIRYSIFYRQAGSSSSCSLRTLFLVVTSPSSLLRFYTLRRWREQDRTRTTGMRWGCLCECIQRCCLLARSLAQTGCRD